MKKLISLFTTLSIVFSMLGTFTVFAAESGTYKDTMTWTLDDDGTLTISGTGVVAYDPDDPMDFNQLPWNESREQITQIIFEEGITGIEGEWTFSGLENLRSVTFPESITVIGYEAFMDCPALTSVTIPAGVKEIRERAFCWCETLTEINVDENNPYYASLDGVLCNKEKTEIIQFPTGRSDTSYTFPDRITSIGDNAFMYDSNLTSIIIPDNIKSISYNAFYFCENLADISIGSGVTEIGRCAFDWTAYHNDETKWDNDVLYIGEYLIDAKDEISGDYEIKNGTRVIADDAFSYCRDLTGVTIPDSVMSIGESAFDNCDKITDIVIPYGVTKISEDMFSYCTNLASVTMPNSVKSIEAGAFYLCRKLTSVDIPNSVTSIGDRAFQSCGLTSITIPAGVTSIEAAAFAGCHLAEFNVDTDNPNYISENGILFNKEKTELICYPSEKTETSYAIPNSVITIEKSAFHSCKSLTEITVPDSVKSIGNSAFSYCSGLTEFTIPNSVTEIGVNVFSGCKSLESIAIGEGVKSINYGAFQYCDALTEITISDNVTDIDDYAFYYCKNLESVIIGSGVTTIGFCAFHNCNKLKDIYYHGTQSDFEKISIDDNNSPLASATKHYAPTVIEISTLAELEAFRDDVNGGNTYKGKTVKLTADINMSEKYGEGKESWTPIGWYVYSYTGSHSVPFSGIFDGGGHKIKGLYYYNDNENKGLECVGFFGVNNGIIKNLGVTGSITHFYYRGSTGGIAAHSNGIIKNCYFSGTITSPSYVGGIAGENDGQIIDCYNTGTIKGFRYVGGLAGISEFYRIQNTYNTGNIIKMSAEEAGKDYNGSDSKYLGSITGSNYDGADIINSYYLEGTYDIGTFVDEGTDPTTALTTEQFEDKSNFTNWDFGTVWEMNAALGRPFLRSNREAELHSHDMSVDCGNENPILFTKALTSRDGKLYINGQPAQISEDVYILPAGSYYLAENVSLNGGIYIQNNVKLCLDGKTLDMGENGIDVYKFNNILSICDCGTTGTVVGKCSSSHNVAALLTVMNECILYGGTIHNNTSDDQTDPVPAIYVYGGDVKILGGKVIAEHNSAIKTTSASTTSLTLSGAPIIKGADNFADIYLYNYISGVNINYYPRQTITIDAPLTGGAYRLDAYDAAVFTSGWNKYMGNADFSDYFISTKKGCFVNKNADGELELKKYSVANQPSKENNYTITTSPEASAFKWYSATAETVTSENAEALEDSVYEDGVWKVHAYTTRAKYFTVQLKAGDMLKTKLLSNKGIDYVGVTDSDNQSYTIEPNGNNEYEFIADSDGEFTFFVQGIQWIFSIPDVTAIAIKNISVDAVEGQTTNQFTGAEGSYICRAEYADGTVVTSNIIDTHTHTHTLVYHAAVAATCTEKGTGEYWKCEGADACNKMFTDTNGTTEITEIPTTTATGHNYGAWSISEEPTDYVPGYAERICQNDNEHKDFAFLPVLTDETVWTAGAKVEPTETADGSQVYTSDYGNVTITIPALGHTHDWGAWSIAKEPTETETGTARRTCTGNAAHKDTITIPVLTNTTVWTAGARVEPTETENGSQVYTSIYGTVTVILPATCSEYDYSIKYENGKAIVTVPQDGTYTVIFAAYDNGRLLSVNAQDIQLIKGENSPISPQNFNANGKVKVMLWDSLMGMKPLCAADGN